MYCFTTIFPPYLVGGGVVQISGPGSLISIVHGEPGKLTVESDLDVRFFNIAGGLHVKCLRSSNAHPEDGAHGLYMTGYNEPGTFYGGQGPEAIIYIPNLATVEVIDAAVVNVSSYARAFCHNLYDRRAEPHP